MKTNRADKDERTQKKVALPPERIVDTDRVRGYRKGAQTKSIRIYKDNPHR
jgi:hypothetical protein